MASLAINGGKPAIKGPLRLFNRIGPAEISLAIDAIGIGPLSGFLGGEKNGGRWVTELEERFCEQFGVKHAIAVNSATSGLLIACRVCGVGPGSDVAVPVLTMSATAAAPAFLGANIKFGDVEHDTFDMAELPSPMKAYDAIIVTNLFGHPAYLKNLRHFSDIAKYYLIEDNAQGILAMEDGNYAGTIGHIGVFSLNVHKHIHCGEGGICLTNDDMLADAMRLARNHGELGGGEVGLNLRMTEVEAAIACAQMVRLNDIVEDRIHQAEVLSDLIVPYNGLVPPMVREGYKHVYYMWALTVEKERDWFVKAMNAEGFPIKAGYVDPLYRLNAFKKYRTSCPVAEKLHDTSLCTFENCAYDPTREQMKQIKEAFDKVGEEYVKRTRS